MHFKIDQNTRSSKFFRIINEIPTILLILIVFIVILSQSRLEILLKSIYIISIQNP